LLPKDKQPKELKVTDKRIFTPEGDIREEFKQEIRPADPAAGAATPPPPPREEKRAEAPRADTPRTEERRQRDEPPPGGEDRRRTMADKASNPGSAFTNFIEPLIAQGYMSLGMLRNPYQPQAKIDTGAARQMIEILTLLKEKTQGNLTPDEADFLDTHLGELKLAFVQRTKSI
jgi:type IV secretory pathway VirB10-like protein